MSGPAAAGLSDAEAAAALERFGPNRIAADARPSALRDLLQRFRNPLVLLLVVAAAISAATGDATGASLIALMIAVSTALDFFQERRAGDAVERLREMVRVTARVRRGGREREIPVADVVPGDLVLLAAGDLVPADGRLLEARDLYVNQATLTGESFPVEKRAAPAAPPAPSAADPGSVVMGSHVVSGTGLLLVARTGRSTLLGETAALAAAPARPGPLEAGTYRFGLMLLRLTVFMALFVVLVNAVLGRPVLESFLFAVALAVGLTPELLPAIVSVTLARGALRLAREEVIVKRPGAVYTLGAMDVLCTDKTGTLTEGSIEVERHVDAAGAPSGRALMLARVNSGFETGLRSPLDEALLRGGGLPASWRKLDEVPFDFERRRVSVLAEAPDGRRLLVVKGAPEALLAHCDRVEAEEGGRLAPLDAAAREGARAHLDEMADAGMRVLAVCWREFEGAQARPGDETGLVLAGFVAFRDPPRADAREALAALAARGVAVKIVTGDDGRVARHLCAQLGIAPGAENRGELAGAEIARMDDDALAAAAERTTVFSRVSPAQKTRVIAALQRRGHVVGYIGDGINDAPALRRADVGISVDGAVDVAKEAADVILLRHHLDVVVAGVVEGRRSHHNVMKYLRMGTSSNFGNMFSMAAAALFLPFLPLLPVQVLLNNVLYDLSEVALPFDRCEEEDLARPQVWNLDAIRRFMLVFGPLSSIFDFLTFGVLLWGFQAAPALFRTGWFIESVASQVLVIFAIRTRRPLLRSSPHPALAASALAVVAAAVAIPFLPGAERLGFTPPPAPLLAAVAVLVATYVALVESLKRRLT
jgi:Mg2+-importing ATPase